MNSDAFVGQGLSVKSEKKQNEDFGLGMIEEESRHSIQKGSLARTTEVSEILESVLGEELKEED